MKRLFINLLCAVFAMLLLASCQSKLAESPYGAREQGWEEFIKNTYPDWEPPQTVPPETKTAPVISNIEENPIIISDDIVITEEIITPTIDVDAAKVDINEAEINTASEFQTYKVEKGDTLWKISRKFYGAGKHWRKIFQANQDVLEAPDKVKTGIDIRIPSSH